MFRLASFLIALWVSFPIAQFEIIEDIKNATTDVVQAVADPVGETVAAIGGSVCYGVQPIYGIIYENFQGEPDMSNLTLVFQNSTDTVTYNLSQAATEIPKAAWFKNTDLLKIYVHGFTDNPSNNNFQIIRQAFATQGLVNILALDASSLIDSFYLRASILVRYIGELLGAVLAALVKLSNLDPENIHLIGHSLGCHISGFAGQMFRELTGHLLARISGLDPAGPCFSKLEPALRLSKGDANFVDVIHTNAGTYGINERVGHADYYPNGGSEQPNCLVPSCSHSRVPYLYAESVRNCTAFIAVKCDSYEDFRNGLCNYTDTSLMGYSASKTTRGTYYLQTNGEEPYGRGQLGLTYQNNVGIVRNVEDTVTDTVTYNLSDAAIEIPKAAWFNNTDLLKIYLHGYTDNPSKNNYQMIRQAFASQANLNPANIHLIGHSLGSHIAGFVGQKFRELTGYLLGRISGLDPAGPCFAKLEAALKLSKGDASFVDVTHTNAGTYGINDHVGDAEFYPNGGSEQPNCVVPTCSHSRVPYLYAESVRNCTAFIAVKCDSYEDFRKGLCDYSHTSLMGYCCSNLTRGTYYLQTNGDDPYGRGQLGLTYQNNVGIISNVKDTVSDIL